MWSLFYVSGSGSSASHIRTFWTRIGANKNKDRLEKTVLADVKQFSAKSVGRYSIKEV
jgi:hypothetical protein